jgi:hypothetical protein
MIFEPFSISYHGVAWTKLRFAFVDNSSQQLFRRLAKSKAGKFNQEISVKY